MDLVIDANSVISALIKEGKSSEILVSFSFNFFAPEFLFEEINKYRDEIFRKSHRGEEELFGILNGLRDTIRFYQRGEFSEYLEEAERICPDGNDVEYFALALKLKCGIWSNDKRLKEQDKIKVYSTGDLVGKGI